MGDVLGLGLTHYPPLCFPDDLMSFALQWTLDDPDIPAAAKDPSGWPPTMRAAWGTDRGLAAAAAHRRALLDGCARVRAALDDFAPDLVVVVGDDQYESFRETVVPAVTVLAYDDLEVQPWRPGGGGFLPLDRNVWGEPPDHVVAVRGHPAAGRHLAAALLEQDFDVAYAYRPAEPHALAHAFLNTVLFLDHDRLGFPYPMVGIAVNCYGRRTVSYRGTMSRFGDARPPDPPSPGPGRLFDLGCAVGRSLAASPWRVALVASSSWSHAFLCDRTWRLRPDTVADRSLYDALVRGDHERWRSVTLAEVEDAAQQEVLNWFLLVGAMAELGARPAWSTFVETEIFNSNKVFVVYEPVPGGAG